MKNAEVRKLLEMLAEFDVVEWMDDDSGVRLVRVPTFEEVYEDGGDDDDGEPLPIPFVIGGAK